MKYLMMFTLFIVSPVIAADKRPTTPKSPSSSNSPRTPQVIVEPYKRPKKLVIVEQQPYSQNIDRLVKAGSSASAVLAALEQDAPTAKWVKLPKN